MSDVGRFGVFLPSYIWDGDGPERARGIKAFARTVEELGFDSLFITDHLLAAKRFYSVSFLEPLAALAVAAGVTERVRLGTSILIMPLRNPVMLAKELATLQFLSENRVILGAGVGWNDAEYEAVGVHKSERGKRTDEMLDIMLPLLEGETVTYHGRYYSVDDLFIEPTASQRPEIWIGGGSQLADPKSPDLPALRGVGQGARPAHGRLDPASHVPARRDRPRLGRAAGLLPRARPRPGECVVAHENFLHLVLTNDPVKAREEQHRAFLKVMSAERGPEYLETVYLFGTPDEVIASLQARVDAGVEYFVLHTMTPDPAQLQRLGRRDHPQRHVPGHGRAGPAHVARVAVTRRVGLIGKPLKRRHSQVMHDAAFDAAGIDARYVLLELEPDAVEDAVREARGPDWLGLGVTAPYKRLVAGCATRSRPTPRRSARSTTSRGRRPAGSSGSTRTPPASGPVSSSRWAGRSRGPTSSSPGPAAPPTRSCSPVFEPARGG